MATKYGILSWQVEDANGALASSNIPVFINDAGTWAQINTDAENLMVNIQPPTAGAIVKWSVRIFGSTGFLTVDPDTASDITQTGTLNFEQATIADLQEVVLPALADSQVSGGAVNLATDEMVALVTALTTPGTYLGFVSRAHYAIGDLHDALFSFRKRRPAISRRTKP